MQICSNGALDVEFGCFGALYGPAGSKFNLEALALLRVDIGSAGRGRGKSMPMLLPVTRADVIRRAP